VTDDLAWLTDPGDAEPPLLLAELHATVELERALAARGESPARAAGAVEDGLIGARVVVLGDGVALAEPSTEGRLAAGLARHGEGVHGRYVAAPVALDAVARRAAAAGVRLSRPGAGPFGRQVLVIGRRVEGPHIVLVGPGPDRAVPSRR
jgi:hypothetical protein